MTDTKNILLPSAELTQALEELRSAGSPEELAARSGELVAKYDREWQLAHNAGKPVDGPVVDFLTAVQVHVEALAATEQLSEAVTTLLFGLLSADIAKADTSRFEGLYLRSVQTLAMLLISLADACPAPGCAEHLDVCARYGLGLFTAAYARYLEDGGAPIADRGMDELYRQCAEGGVLDALPPLHGEPLRPLERRGELLVDILTRLRACGLASI